MLYIGGDDGHIREVSTSNFSLRRVFAAPGGYVYEADNSTGNNTVNRLAVSPGGHWLLVGKSCYTGPLGKGNCPYIIKLETGELHCKYPGASQYQGSFMGPDQLLLRVQQEGKLCWLVKVADVRQQTQRMLWGFPAVGDKRNDGWAFGTDIFFSGTHIVALETKRLRTWPWPAVDDIVDLKFPDDPNHVVGGDPPSTHVEGGSAAVGPKGDFVTVDRGGVVRYYASATTDFRVLGRAAETTGFFQGAVTTWGDKFITFGSVDGYPTPVRIWDPRGKESREFAAVDRGRTALAQAASTKGLFAVSTSGRRGYSGRVDIYDLASGKLIASLASPYQADYRSVRVTRQ